MGWRFLCTLLLLLPLSLDAQEGTFDTAVFRLAAKVRKSNAKIVVCEIEAPPQMARLAKKLRLKLEEALLKQEQTVLTRDLDVLLDELNMQRSALFDGTTMRKIGQFAGATAILRGLLLADTSGIELYLRLVDVETGKELAAASGKIPQLASDKRLPEESPAFQKGHRLREHQEWELAARSYGDAMAEFGEQAVYFFYRALCYSHLEQNDKALADYGKALALEPQYASAHNARGVLYEKLGKLKQAEDDYEAAIRCDPGHAHAYFSLGNIHMARGEYAKAIRRNLTATKLWPEHPAFCYNLACAYALHGDTEEALAALTKAISYGASREYARRDEDLAGLRGQARFQELVK
jgi:tetratricopeptide (TPR) repeat protein